MITPANLRRIHNLRTRSDLFRLVRRFFFEKDYLEVETPVRGPAPIPEAHIDLFESEEGVLFASPEIFMKPLLTKGFDRIFQIARVFRKGERGSKHLPEFSLLEWYKTDAGYRDLMDDLEGLLPFLSQELGHGSSLSYQGRTVSLLPPWERITVKESFDKYGSVSLTRALETDRFDEIMGLEIEPCLGLVKPVFLYDYPLSKGSLARLSPDDPTVTERVEFYICGLELANGFSELTDADEQRRRFYEEHRLRSSLNKTNYPLPEDFLNALGAMPPSAGMALGLDRLTMLFCDTEKIDDVVAFLPGV